MLQVHVLICQCIHHSREILPHELCDMPECTREGPCEAHSKHRLDCGNLGGTQHKCGQCSCHNHTIHFSDPNSLWLVLILFSMHGASHAMHTLSSSRSSQLSLGIANRVSNAAILASTQIKCLGFVVMLLGFVLSCEINCMQPRIDGSEPAERDVSLSGLTC